VIFVQKKRTGDNRNDKLSFLQLEKMVNSHINNHMGSGDKMKIGVIEDVQGNAPALKAVLDACEVRFSNR